MKRILVSLLAAIAVFVTLTNPVLADRAQLGYDGLTLLESAPNENFAKAAAVRNTYLAAQVPAIEKALKEIVADGVISPQDWADFIPLINKFKAIKKKPSRFMATI